jgi:hypothetical protein
MARMSDQRKAPIKGDKSENNKKSKPPKIRKKTAAIRLPFVKRWDELGMEFLGIFKPAWHSVNNPRIPFYLTSRSPREEPNGPSRIIFILNRDKIPGILPIGLLKPAKDLASQQERVGIPTPTDRTISLCHHLNPYFKNLAFPAFGKPLIGSLSQALGAFYSMYSIPPASS